MTTRWDREFFVRTGGRIATLLGWGGHTVDEHDCEAGRSRTTGPARGSG